LINPVEKPVSPSLQNVLSLVARVLLAAIFIKSGWGKIGGFDGTVGYIASKGLPMAQVVAALTILVEVGAGLALVVGLFTRWSAAALAAFTLLAAFIFHAYWAVPPEQAMMQNIQFMKNLAIAGGLFAVVAFGAGALSIDARRRTA
jgi:putative oxidoreductase